MVLALTSAPLLISNSAIAAWPSVARAETTPSKTVPQVMAEAAVHGVLYYGTVSLVEPPSDEPLVCSMQTTNEDGRIEAAGEAEDARAWTLVFVAWLIASASTLGALFFGEIMKLPPCSLCWYQRIFMFPMALILPFGLFPFDRNVVRAVLPLAGFGGMLAVLHVLLVEGIIPERVAPCRQGVPCSETVAEWFGFVTIPLLSFVAFATIVFLLMLALSRSTK